MMRRLLATVIVLLLYPAVARVFVFGAHVWQPVVEAAYQSPDMVTPTAWWALPALMVTVLIYAAPTILTIGAIFFCWHRTPAECL